MSYLSYASCLVLPSEGRRNLCNFTPFLNTPVMVLRNYCFKLHCMPSHVLLTEHESQATEHTQKKNISFFGFWGWGGGGGRHRDWRVHLVERWAQREAGYFPAWASRHHTAFQSAALLLAQKTPHPPSIVLFPLAFVSSTLTDATNPG